jgi:hypothetical protein
MNEDKQTNKGTKKDKQTNKQTNEDRKQNVSIRGSRGSRRQKSQIKIKIQNKVQPEL